MQKRLNHATKQSISSCNKGYIGRRKRLFYDAKQALWSNVKREHIARRRHNSHIRLIYIIVSLLFHNLRICVL